MVGYFEKERKAMQEVWTQDQDGSLLLLVREVSWVMVVWSVKLAYERQIRTMG